MEIVLADDYEPVGDESFSLLHFGSLSETFSQVTFSGNGLEWDDTNLYSDGVLPVHPTNSLPGDANQDGVVDIADMGIIGANWSASGRLTALAGYAASEVRMGT